MIGCQAGEIVFDEGSFRGEAGRFGPGDFGGAVVGQVGGEELGYLDIGCWGTPEDERLIGWDIKGCFDCELRRITISSYV